MTHSNDVVQIQHMAQNVLDHSARPLPGERVLVIAEESTEHVARHFLRAALAYDPDARLVVMPMLPGHGAEPPAEVAAAMLRADLLIVVTTHAISHSDARRQAAAAGARSFILRSVTEDTLLNGAVNADYADIARVCERLAERFRAGRNVRLTTPRGTDLSFSIAQRAAFPMGGVLAAQRGALAGLPSGETAVSPVEWSANGVAVIEHYIDDIGRLNSPVVIRFESGRVASVDAGPYASALMRVLDRDENAGNLAEFAIGTNPAARLLGNGNEDKLHRGSVHLGLGDNRTVLGGNVASISHVDATILRPTVLIDDEAVVTGGRIASAILAR